MKNLTIVSKRLFIFLGILLLFGCDAVQNSMLTELPATTETAPLRVTMVYPSDCVGASAYCDSFHVGLKAAEAELGISLTEVSVWESDPNLAEKLFREAAQESDLVLTAGYQMEVPLSNVAPEFPDTQFAIFDVVLDIPNVAAINYKANEGSFLVGAVAGLKTESNKIGYIGGADVPLLQEFEAGYIAGIQAVNPDAEIFVEYISVGPAGFLQPKKAEALALAQYESGVDVIYVAAGGSGEGVLEAAKAQQKYIIWVDSNGNHLAPGIVLTSMVKELESSTQRIVREAIAGEFMAGIRYFGVKDDGVSYALDEHNQALLSEDIITTVESLKTKIVTGEITVPDTVSLPRR